MGLFGIIGGALAGAVHNAIKNHYSGNSGGSSSHGGGSVNVGNNGNAPGGLSTGSIVHTAGGDYEVTDPGQGTYNPNSGYWSKPHHDGLVMGNGTGSGGGYPGGGSSGGSSYQPPYQPSYQQPQNNDYYNQLQQQLEAQKRAQEEAIRQATQQTVDSINAYQPQINQDYENQQRQNYIANQQALASMGDYMKASGLTGGATETARLGLQSDYQNSRSTADQQRNEAQLKLQQMAQQAQSTGNTQLAGAAGDYYKNYAQLMGDMQAQNNWQQQFDFNKNLQMQDKQKQDALASMGQYYNDYAGQALKFQNDGDPTNDWMIPYLWQSHYNKQNDLDAKANAQAQQDFNNQIKWGNLQNQNLKTNYQIKKPYYNPKKSKKTSSQLDLAGILKGAGLY